MFSYDGRGRLTGLSDGLGASSFTYSDGGQMTSEDGPWLNDTVTFSYNKKKKGSVLNKKGVGPKH